MAKYMQVPGSTFDPSDGCSSAESSVSGRLSPHRCPHSSISCEPLVSRQSPPPSRKLSAKVPILRYSFSSERSGRCTTSVVSIALQCVALLMLIVMTVFFLVAFAPHVPTPWYQITFQRTVRTAVFEAYEALRANVEPTGPQDTCITPTCLRLSNHIQQRINASLDPCDDFYEFSCGQWLQNTAIPPMFHRLDIFFDMFRNNMERIASDLQNFDPTKPHGNATRKAHMLYKACLNEPHLNALGAQPLANFIKKQLGGGWALIDKKINLAAFGNWTLHNVLLKMASFGFQPVIWVGVAIDEKNTSRNILTLDTPLLTTAYRWVSVNESTNEPHSLNFPPMKRSIELILLVAEMMGQDKTAVRWLAENITMLEADLAVTFPHSDEQLNTKKLYHVVTVGQLKKLVPLIDWGKFFNEVIKDHGFVVTDSEPVLLRRGLDWIKRFANFTNKYSRSNYEKMLLDTYLKWYVAYQMFPHLSPNMYDQMATFGTSAMSFPRWLFCIQTLRQSLTLVASALWIRGSRFSDKRATMTQNIVDQLKFQFQQNLKQLDWMDGPTRRNALAKLPGMIDQIGYPGWIMNDTRLDEFYDTFDVRPNDYFGAMLDAFKFYRHMVLRTLRSKPAFNEWLFPASPEMPNAFFKSEYNRLAIPAGILQFPILSEDMPQYAMYGGLGTILGHEITHAFDAAGSEYDSHGNLREWWTPEVHTTFRKKSKCFVAQYSNYSVSDSLKRIQKPLNGTRTLSENIADNGAVRLAYKTYSEWAAKHGPEQKLPGLNFTTNQLFFVHFAQQWCGKGSLAYDLHVVDADAHAPSKFRVLGPLRNLPEFANVWKCPLGAPMNPVGKCELW